MSAAKSKLSKFGLRHADGKVRVLTRHEIMMTLSNGNFSALLASCAGNSPVTGEFPAQRPVTRSFDVFFDLCLNKRLSKQSWGGWFEMPSHSLWRHRNVKWYLPVPGGPTKASNVFFIHIHQSSRTDFLSTREINQQDMGTIDLVHKSQNAPVPYPATLHSEQKCVHFCSEWSIVGYATGAFWDLWNWSVDPKSS